MPIKKREPGHRRRPGGKPGEDRRGFKGKGPRKPRDGAAPAASKGEPRAFSSRKPKGSFGARDSKARPPFDPGAPRERPSFEGRGEPRTFSSRKPKGSFGARDSKTRPPFDPGAPRERPAFEERGEARSFGARKPRRSFDARFKEGRTPREERAPRPPRDAPSAEPGAHVFRSHRPKGSFGSQRDNESNFEPRKPERHAPADSRPAQKRGSPAARKPRDVDVRKLREREMRKPRGFDSGKPQDRDPRKPRDGGTARAPYEGRPPRQFQPSPAPVQVKPGPVAAPQVASAVQTITVSADEGGMRVDRYFESRYPGLSFSHIQRIVRKGEVRVNGKRVDTKDRLQVGQQVRIPPLKLDAPKRTPFLSAEDEKTRDFLRSITLHEDDDVLVLNKPMGLSVQGGSGTTRHLDGMLEVLRGPGVDAQRPRLVHRLDKDTAGCLLVAKTRFAAAALAKTFRTRSARKTYWALVAGVPKPQQGRISTYLAKEEREEDSFMRVAQHGEEGASHAVTYYTVVEKSASTLAWVSLKPVTGRTHQLRAHMAHIGYPIVGDPKYFQIENWQLPGGLQNRLHLMARRIVVPHPRGGEIDVTAPLPLHMQQTWNLLGLDVTRYDPIVEAPEED